MPGRLLMDEPASGAWNMAVDEAILDAVAAGRVPVTLRFYRWRPACLSLGYFQPASVVNAGACAERGVDIVRRPTGGRAILHHDELTYSIAMRVTRLGPATVSDSYQRLSRALLKGLRASGYPVTIAAGATDGGRAGPACFTEPAAHELLLAGKKVVGSAQVRRSGAMLQHGSILFSAQVAETIACLNHPQAGEENLIRTMEASVGGLSQVRQADTAPIVSEIVRAFERVLRLEFQGGRLGPEEERLARALETTRYAPDAWMERELAASGGEKATRTR